MPKSRYGIMKPYMEKVGTLGTSMMYRSCTVQANLDFSDEADMVKKLRVSLALQPIATALFANSPFVDGKPSGYLSFRSHIWLNTDHARTGMLPFAFEDGLGFERYADYALDVPMYFVIRDGEYVNVAGESFRAFLDGKLPQLPGEKPTVKDWENHLSTMFPEVRLKQFLEMRGADMGERRRRSSRCRRFWIGLLYDADCARCRLGAGQGLDRRGAPGAARRRAATTAIHTPFPQPHRRRDRRRHPGARLRRSRRRARLDAAGADETRYLAPLEEILDSRKTAGRALARPLQRRLGRRPHAASSTKPRSSASRLLRLCRQHAVARSTRRAPPAPPRARVPIPTIGSPKSPRNTARSASTICLNGLKSDDDLQPARRQRHRQQDAREQQDRQRQRVDQRRQRILALGRDADGVGDERERRAEQRHEDQPDERGATSGTRRPKR